MPGRPRLRHGRDAESASHQSEFRPAEPSADTDPEPFLSERDGRAGRHRLRPAPAQRRTLSDLADLRDQLAAQAAERAESARRDAREQAERLREARLFLDAIADAIPLPPSGRIRHRGPKVDPEPHQTRRDEQDALAESLSDEIDIERLLEHDDRLSFRRPGVGREALARLRRGAWTVQARLDLHGLRRDEAREAVVLFLAQALRDGRRCVRIIHGKGLGSVDRRPILKDKVLRWLAQRDEVLAFCEAPPFAGGAGAVLVLLRAPAAGRHR